MVTAAELNSWWTDEYPEGHEYEGQTPGEDGPEEYFYTWSGKPDVETPWGPGELIEQVGGEGQGDHTHVVAKIDGQFFKIDGYYSSWEGSDWSDSEWYEAEPVEKTVIEYVKKKS